VTYARSPIATDETARPTWHTCDSRPIAISAGRCRARRPCCIKTKVPPPVAPTGHFIKDDFTLDLAAGTATCPAGVTAAFPPYRRRPQECRLRPALRHLPARRGLSHLHDRPHHHSQPHEQQLTRARTARADPAWQALRGLKRILSDAHQ
jgi:hypothetical protein